MTSLATMAGEQVEDDPNLSTVVALAHPKAPETRRSLAEQ
jgi:hypothetical protein